MKKRTQFIFYFLIVVFYAVIFYMAKCTRGEERNETNTTTEEISRQVVCIGSDSLMVNWNLLLPEEPMLMTEKKADDTLLVNINRYQSPSMTGLGIDKELPVELLMRTDRFADFLLRFNGDSTKLAQFNGKMDFTALGEVSEREGHILSLVNSIEPLRDTTVRKFAADIHKNNITISNWPDANYLAVATFAYKDTLGNVFPVRLTFEQAMVEDAPVWYVIQAESPYFTFGDKNNPYYIDFIENEMNFMGLADNTDRAATSVAGPAFKGDGLSAFLILTSKDFITYQHADYIQYILKAGEYTLLVEPVENFEHKRSGLLITRIIKDNRLIFANQPY